ncbi:MAG TPA: hypothetical protein VK426_04890, partial [Methanobacterium sp.]|nr:hypothetical protein [Methanobacterium sp.]
LPQLANFKAIIVGSGLASIIIFPISAYFLILAVGFFSALIYNLLSHRLGGVKLKMENNEITKIHIMPFSLTIASIEGILALIVGLFSAAAIIPLTAIIGEFQTIAYIFNVIIGIIIKIIPISAAFGVDGYSLTLFLVIGFPIIIFIIGIISNVLFAIFYNYIATRFIKIQLDLTKISETTQEIRSLPVVPSAAPTAAAVFGTFGVLMGFISLLSLAVTGNPGVGNIVNDITVLVLNGISYFIGYFLIFALISVIYNFLAPKIGGIKLNFE